MRYAASIVLLVCLSAVGPDAAFEESKLLERVRTTNARISKALREGEDKAPTFRALLERLRQSDVIVHIQPGECSCGSARSCVSLVTRSGSVRYLRATVSLRQIQKELISHIGHELFHATEIAAAAEIVDAPTLRAFYERRGRRTCGLPCGYETPAALSIHARLRVELEGQALDAATRQPD